MATSAQSSPQDSADVWMLVDELRMIIEAHNGQEAKSLVADFIVRHGLTDDGVKPLLAALAAQGDATDLSAALAVRNPDDEPSLGGPPATVAAPQDMAKRWAEPYDAATSPSDEFDDDLAWMFGEEAEPSTPRAADDVMGRALDDLLGDWSRTGGQLTHAEVALLAVKRNLSPVQHSELLNRMKEAGVDLPDITGPQPTQAAAPKGGRLQRDSVSLYLRAIARYPLIDGTREVELWSLISQGRAAQQELDASSDAGLALNVQQSLQAQAALGRHAHAELVCANLRLVVSIAGSQRYGSSTIELADRIQDGNLGLIRAADKFDGSKGFKFSTYATWWIQQEIERGIANRGRTIRLPVHMYEQVQKVRREVSKLTARLDREPTLAEISNATDMAPGKAQFVLDLIRPLVSLDAPIGNEGDLRLSDVLVHEEERDGRADPAEIVIHAMFREDVAHMLGTLLPERSARVLQRRFGLGTGDEETLEAIGADIGLTRERIRQIQSEALAKLGKSRYAAALRSYLVDDSKAGTGSVERKSDERRDHSIEGAGVRGIRRLARSSGGSSGPRRRAESAGSSPLRDVLAGSDRLRGRGPQGRGQ